MSLRDVAHLIETGELSPPELTTQMLDRIAKYDPMLESYATIMRVQALADARAAEREIRAGNYRGPLHGVPIAVKDLFYTKGVRTMGGSLVHKEFVPTFDATVVSKLRAAYPRQGQPDGGGNRWVQPNLRRSAQSVEC